jgi:hypothetical protein
MSMNTRLQDLFLAKTSTPVSLPQADSPDQVNPPSANPSKTFKAFVVGQLSPMMSEKTRRAVLPMLAKRASKKSPPPIPQNPPKPRQLGMLPLSMPSRTNRPDFRDIEGSTRITTASASEE